jgi:hypothetical protein
MPTDPVAHALSYPFRIPARSYVMAGGHCRELDAGAPAPDVAGRRPVLAAGSNQSPERLIRKYGTAAFGAIPVVRARLHDFDIVYSAHVSAYGSIPATLWPCPGTTVTLFINWLDRPQETRMHETEVPSGNYHFGSFAGIRVRAEQGGELSAAFAYISRRGALLKGGRPVALSAVAAENRRWPALGQDQVQGHVRDRLEPGRPLDAFVRAAIDDADERRARIAALARDAAPFADDRFTIIEV